jgi:NhaP-type Na+/H+ or K+/H+ antiporter
VERFSAVTSFQTGAATIGGLLVLGALLTGLARRSILSLAAVFVLAGFILGKGALGVLDFHPDSPFVSGLATAGLILILFRDGLEVESELLQRHWHLPLRHLAIGMPVTALIVALLARVCVGLGWDESLLLGALLSPTDPILTSRVVTDERVPAVVRHTLNLESGLNDGLALPAVLAFAAALETRNSGFVWWHYVLQDIGLGLVYGLVLGFLGSLLLPTGSDDRAQDGAASHRGALSCIGLALATYGLAVIPPHGNGFIAVFVAAIVVGNRRADLRAAFADQAEVIVEVVKLGIFAVFGSLLTLSALFHDGWAAVAVVAGTFLLARPAAIFLALAGTRVSRASKAFMAWFGPKGVATITFSVLILAKGVTNGRRVVDLAALAVFSSIIVHGASETPAIRWLARREPRPASYPAVPASSSATESSAS